MLNGLTEELSLKIDDLLLELLVRAEAEAVFLCNRGGYILADSMVQHYSHNENIAALAAGSFFATREIASLVGEPEFRSVFHQGDCKSIYMQVAAAELLVVVVFGRQSNPGLVKLCASETCRALERAFKKFGQNGEVETLLQSIELNVDGGGQLFSPVAGPAVAQTAGA
jgi:predicted regulator of Ras-like GTPase activity (Roadblock/LC7/MglB family)